MASNYNQFEGSKFQDGEPEDLSYDYRPSDAYFQREVEFKKSLLIDEFKQADINKDNYLDEHELLSFLDKKVRWPYLILMIEQEQDFW